MTRTPRFLPLAFVSALALTVPTMMMPTVSVAQVGVSITLAPPPLPVYAQPVIPGPDYIFMPGYWAWGGPNGYYWVPGTWVEPPEAGLLWTPGYWAWANGGYLWRAGYWGPEVGFYGGIDYGFGYTGSGYYGGRWDHGHFFYNRAVNNFGSVHITNVFNEPVHVTHVTRVSFNGGRGGLTARPNAQQQAFASQHHVDRTSAQASHEHAAAGNHGLFASVNHGRPDVAATSRPASFEGAGVVHARNAATYHPAAATTAGSGATPGANPRDAGAHPDNRAAGEHGGTQPGAGRQGHANGQGGAPAHVNAAPAAHMNAATPHGQVAHPPQQQHTHGAAHAPAASHRHTNRPTQHTTPHPAAHAASAPHGAPHPGAPHPDAHPAAEPHASGNPHDDHH